MPWANTAGACISLLGVVSAPELRCLAFKVLGSELSGVVECSILPHRKIIDNCLSVFGNGVKVSANNEVASFVGTTGITRG